MESHAQSRRLEEQGKLVVGKRSYHKSPPGEMAVGSYLAGAKSGHIQFHKEGKLGRVPTSYAKKQGGVLGNEVHKMEVRKRNSGSGSLEGKPGHVNPQRRQRVK